MKKYILSLLTLMTILSCEKSVEFNNPALQGFINGSIWKATAMQAKKGASGTLLISGTSAAGLMELRLNSTALGKRTFGTVSALSSVAYNSLSDTPSFKYATNVVPGPVNLLLPLSSGTGYTTASLVPTTGGSGTGLKVDFETNSSGAITTIKVNSPGNFYKAGDVVTVTGGGANATFTVQNTSNSNGEITITEFDGVTISGNFKFIAFDATATPTTAVCREGTFYKIPVN
jgi:Family of unknown function (DUF6252)